MNALQEFIDELYSLAAEAYNEPNKKERSKKIKEARTRACAFMLRLNSQLGKLLSKLFEDAALTTSEGVKVRIKDIAADDPVLEVFRSKEELESFLNATAEILRLSGVAPDVIFGLSARIEKSYRQIVEQKLDAEQLKTQFDKLKGYFCPDDGGGGGPKNSGPGDGPSGPEEKLIGRLGLLVAAASLFLQLFPPAASPPETTPEPPPISIPFTPVHLIQLRLLGLLFLAAMADEISLDGGFSPTTPPDHYNPSGSDVDLVVEKPVYAQRYA